MSGLEVTEILHAERPDLPIIATTANAFNDDREACLKAGCREYITKPIAFDRLFEIIASYLTP